MFYYALGAAFLGFGSYCGDLLLVLCLSVFGVFCSFVVFVWVVCRAVILCGCFTGYCFVVLVFYFGLISIVCLIWHCGWISEFAYPSDCLAVMFVMV